MPNYCLLRRMAHKRAAASPPSLTKFLVAKPKSSKRLKLAFEEASTIENVITQNTAIKTDGDVLVTQTATATTTVVTTKTCAQEDAQPDGIEWHVHQDSVLLGSYKYHGQAYDFKSTLPAGGKQKFAIAAFDLDGTLIATKSGFPFARDENDWQFRFGEKKTLGRILKSLDEQSAATDHSLLVVFSNQAGVALAPKKPPKDIKKTRLWQFKSKLEDIVRPLGTALYIVASTNKDNFRKPQTGMWDLLRDAHGKNCLNGNIEIELDKQNSFFVGDAAGRKGDHSKADIEFAKNLGINFYTPEEYFDNIPLKSV
ncbi:polynucleotide kinase 3 phosphatase-domain-containing protein [Lipomyces japonicus]|uniref:polynucleotide kinase 3 phosphatase-domain-containing protein n=1 Tax=Lipomyces japonicus TaxID=56871 RepID=UPI0034CD899A